MRLYFIFSPTSKQEFIDGHIEIEITKVDSIKILDDNFAPFEGQWKRY